MSELERPVRVARVGLVVISHHPEVPDVDYARREVRHIKAMLAELDRPIALLTLADRVFPVASSEVLAAYREAAEGVTITAWAGVVAGVMGFAASIAFSIGARVFAPEATPMRVFQRIPQAVAWLGATVEIGTSEDELVRVAERISAGD
jgi:hypothetical protein